MASVLLRVGARHLPRLAAINATQRAAPIVAMAANRLDVLSTTVMNSGGGEWGAERGGELMNNDGSDKAIY